MQVMKWAGKHYHNKVLAHPGTKKGRHAAAIFACSDLVWVILTKDFCQCQSQDGQDEKAVSPRRDELP